MLHFINTATYPEAPRSGIPLPSGRVFADGQGWPSAAGAWMRRSGQRRTPGMADGAVVREGVSRGERGASGRYIPVIVKWTTKRHPPGHRTNTGTRIRQTATRVSDRCRYRRASARITMILPAMKERRRNPTGGDDNALDRSRNIGCPLGAWFGHLVHDGWIHSRSPGHRDRGGADQCHSGTKGRVATPECRPAARSGQDEEKR